MTGPDRCRGALVLNGVRWPCTLQAGHTGFACHRWAALAAATGRQEGTA